MRGHGWLSNYMNHQSLYSVVDMYRRQSSAPARLGASRCSNTASQPYLDPESGIVRAFNMHMAAIAARLDGWKG